MSLTVTVSAKNKSPVAVLHSTVEKFRDISTVRKVPEQQKRFSD